MDLWGKAEGGTEGAERGGLLLYIAQGLTGSSGEVRPKPVWPAGA